MDFLDPTVIRNELKLHLSQLERVTDSEKFVVQHARYKLLKRILLLFLKVHTNIQTAFNKEAVRVLRIMLDHIKFEINALHTEITYLRTRPSKTTKKGRYASRYFPGHEESFYLFQQEKFRGSFDVIKERQKQYIPFLETVRNLNSIRPFVEVGFGRGEFLDILRETGLKNTIGIETNKARVMEVQKKGYKAVAGDAVDFLMQFRGEISGLSAFHVVEHMEFEEIFDLIYAAYQKLAENGLVIVETPNPENLQVGSYSFYIDHTHITKLPPKFLQSVFEYIGFSTVKIVYSTPLRSNIKTETDRLLYGDLDYAIVAYK